MLSALIDNFIQCLLPAPQGEAAAVLRQKGCARLLLVLAQVFDERKVSRPSFLFLLLSGNCLIVVVLVVVFVAILVLLHLILAAPASIALQRPSNLGTLGVKLVPASRARRKRRVVAAADVAVFVYAGHYRDVESDLG